MSQVPRSIYSKQMYIEEEYEGIKCFVFVKSLFSVQKEMILLTKRIFTVTNRW